MVITLKLLAVKKVTGSWGWITPSPVADKEGVRKRAHLSSPVSPHFINNIGTDGVDGMIDAVEFNDDNIEGVMHPSTNDYNILIPQLSLLKFISDNFNRKPCNGKFRERTILVHKIGFASNSFWRCPNTVCPGAASIIAPTCQTEASGKFRMKHPKIPGALSNYAINRQVVLACQQSGGGARMASTFGGLLSISKWAIWIRCFSQVEELLAKFQILLGKKLVANNLKNEIALNPMNEDLQKASSS
jgi:hypothetical protein